MDTNVWRIDKIGVKFLTVKSELENEARCYSSVWDLPKVPRQPKSFFGLNSSTAMSYSHVLYMYVFFNTIYVPFIGV